MDNERKDTPFPENDNWLDDILGASPETKEIGPDEQAIYAAGLTHPNDVEIENILAENWKDQSTRPIDLDLQKLAKPSALEERSIRRQASRPEPKPVTKPASKPVSKPVSKPAAKPSSKPVIKSAAIPTEETAPEVEKGRPEKKKGYGLLGIPHILVTFVWLLVIVIAGVTLGNTLWNCCADVMAFGKPSQEVTITVTDNDDLEAVAKKLADAGLVRYPDLFRFFAQITGKDDNISAGTFKLNSHLDYNAMVNAMGSNAPSREVVEIAFPEGYNCAQIFRLLAEKNVCSEAELEEYAANGELTEYWFLQGVSRGSKYCLEGYMAPDTYKFYTNDEPRRVIEKFLDEFDDRFTDIMKQDFENIQNKFADMLASHGYDSQYIEDHKLTLHGLLTIASLVQKETSGDTESYDIASVFINRLAHPDHPYLGSDASVYYAIGDYYMEHGELTAADLEVDSPYNTRNHEGLPPGPICNPGAVTLYSVLDPNDTDYYYFVYSTAEGKHLFSKTYAEHVDKVNALG